MVVFTSHSILLTYPNICEFTLCCCCRFRCRFQYKGYKVMLSEKDSLFLLTSHNRIDLSNDSSVYFVGNCLFLPLIFAFACTILFHMQITLDFHIQINRSNRSSIFLLDFSPNENTFYLSSQFFRFFILSMLFTLSPFLAPHLAHSFSLSFPL